MMQYSVFICVCGKDSLSLFKKAYNSVLEQTVLPSQIVICADGSLYMALEEYLSQIENNEITDIVRVDSDSDHAISRAAALSACKYELVGVLDADDIAMPDRFETQLKMFNDESLSVVGGAIIEYSDKEIIGMRVLPCTDAEIKEYMKKRCPFNHMTVMYKKSDVLAAGGYKSLYCEEDYFLWARMALKGFVFANTEKVLCKSHVSGKTYARRGGHRYYRAEKKLFSYMKNAKMISSFCYRYNIFVRYITQIVMSDKQRARFYKRFLRKKAFDPDFYNI